MRAVYRASSVLGVPSYRLYSTPAIPPELLVARQRQQLADQLKSTYQRERVAQEQRIAVEKSRSTADQQGELVRAQIAVPLCRLTEILRSPIAPLTSIGRPANAPTI